MRREERVTVQGPVKEQQRDGMSHRGSSRCSHVLWLLVGGRERDCCPPAHGCCLCPCGVHLCRCAQRASVKVFPRAVRHANCRVAWRVLCTDVDLVRGRCHAAQPVGSPLRIRPEVASPASRSLVLTRACDQTQGQENASWPRRPAQGSLFGGPAPPPPRMVLSF